jgi:starch synthase
MRAAFIAAECEPWAKVGGLGDVVGALAAAIVREPGGRVDSPVDVFLPNYRGVSVPPGATRTTVRVPDPMAPAGWAEVGILDTVVDGYRLRLVDHPPAFDRDGVYGDAEGDHPDNAWRFGLLCRAALETLRRDGRPVDVLHLHDWHAVPALLFRDRWYADDPVVGPAAVLLTLHNLAYHGWVPANQLRQLGLAVGDPPVPAGADGLSLLRAGIEGADLVNTVSPSYAAEALTPDGGRGLDGALVARGDRFFGILNGIDTEVWNPATDAGIAATFGPGDLAGKSACRRDLLGRLGFAADDPGPVLGMIGRLDPQKGFDLLAAAAGRLIDRGARLVVLGAGDEGLVDPLRSLAAARPDRVALIERFDRDLARRIYAGIDLFVMPSRFEPCGLGQLIALRYGSPPVVRRTGGLRDTIVDERTHPGAGTGFAFDDATPDALLGAADAAISLFERGGDVWAGLVERGMAQDFGWETGSAPRYADAYERAVALRRSSADPTVQEAGG